MKISTIRLYQLIWKEFFDFFEDEGLRQFVEAYLSLNADTLPGIIQASFDDDEEIAEYLAIILGIYALKEALREDPALTE